MSLETRLARELLRRHPEDAATALERLPAQRSAAQLSALEPREVAEILARAAPGAAVSLLAALPTEGACAACAALDPAAAANLLRRSSETLRGAVLAGLPEASNTRLRALLCFPENSAGALMDPDVLALPADLSLREALSQVRETPERARYNLYAVDREQHLVGALNLRELLVASPRSSIAEIMTRDPQRLAAEADPAAIVAHPGWLRVHALPVVDRERHYLGALRYRTLRTLEREMRGPAHPESAAARALADLFSAGAAGLVEALAGTATARTTEES